MSKLLIVISLMALFTLLNALIVVSFTATLKRQPCIAPPQPTPSIQQHVPKDIRNLYPYYA